MAAMFPFDSRILVVDDQMSMRESVRSQLRSLGYRADRIKQSSDGKHALDTLETSYLLEEPFDLVFLDWEMPKMTGLEVLKAVRAHPQLSKLPIIMLTAVNLHDQVLEAIKSGVDNYIVKPFTISVLTDKLVKTWAMCQKR